MLHRRKAQYKDGEKALLGDVEHGNIIRENIASKKLNVTEEQFLEQVAQCRKQ